MTGLLADFRQAFRTWRYAPWYVATVIGVLTVGLALTTVAFAVVDGVLFKPLPFPAADDLFLIHAEASSAPRPQLSAVSSRDVQAWREAIPELRVTLVSQDPRSGAASIDEGFFDVIGTRPLLGGFASQDFGSVGATGPSGRRVFPQLISYRRWLDEYGGDASIVGRTIVTADRPGFSAGIRIAGVLPPDFVFPLDTNAGAPEVLSPMRRSAGSNDRSLHAIVRLSAGAAGNVSGRLTAAARALPEAPADTHHLTERLHRVPFDRVQLVALTEHLGRHVRPAFALVLTGAGLLLLLACVNVAGLVGARNVERQRDLAVRRALGAGSWTLARGLVTEVALLAAVATGLALLVARPLLVWTIDLLPETVTLLKDPSLDLRVFTGAAVMALGCALLVAAWPVRQAMRVGVGAALGRGGAGATRRTRRAALPLVSVQVALGFVLVTAGALTVSSLTRAWRNDTGFHRDRMLLLDAYVKQAASAQEITEKLVGIHALLETVDGVDDVAISAAGPVFAKRTPSSSVAPEGWKGKVEGVNSRLVSANFFGVMGLRLLDGRWPSTSEWEDGHIAFVSERAARIFWPGQSAIGRTLVEQGRRATNRYTVAGVVGDARFFALDESPIGDVYLPNPLTPNRYGVYLHVRTREPATAVLPRVLAALSGRDLLLEQASTHEDALFAAIRHRALPAWLFGSLGLGALVVMGAGVLGLLAMIAAQRTREMGIRVALGATRARVVRMLLREQLIAVTLGLAAGALISAWTVGYLESQLYAVDAYDPSVWMLTATALITVAALGTLFPSMRAASVDPVRALRSE